MEEATAKSAQCQLTECSKAFLELLIHGLSSLELHFSVFRAAPLPVELRSDILLSY